MPQQTTLLSFFSRTPKSETSSPSSGSSSARKVNGNDTKFASTNGSQGSSGSDTVVNTCPKSRPERSPAVSTPVSTRNGGTKRRRISGSQSIDNEANRKKQKNDDSPTSEFMEGGLVWAKLDGYPWWPAMLRGEAKGGSISRKLSMEFHVQFFDNPPTRAWVRKGDLKLYVGSHDADIPPAKGDPGWVAACQTADDAMSLNKAQRIQEHWIEFSTDVVEEEAAASSEVEEMEVEPQETPKSRGRTNKKKQHRRIRTISSSPEDDRTARKKKSSNKKNNDDDYSPTKNESNEETESSESPNESDNSNESDVGSEEISDDEETKKKRAKPVPNKKKTAPVTPSNNSAVDKAVVLNRLQQFTPSDSPRTTPSTSTNSVTSVPCEKENTIWTHMLLDWAKEGNRRDMKMRKETHPEYDPRTLHVPDSFLNTLTPATRQWWELKSRNFDTILFFKVGKFYEFYHWDACIAAKELGITYMKGDYAHSGFPEIAFSRFANALVEKGYKIARIEQTETPDMLTQRIKESKKSLAKHEKVIRREICQVSTKGVRYASFQDETNRSPFGPESEYLYAIAEKSTTSGEGTMFGVCFIDTTIGTFHIGQFSDDRHASRLRTLLSHYLPVQILHERGKLSSNCSLLLQNMSGVRKDPLIPESEFWNAKKTLKFLADQKYFRDSESSATNWPDKFRSFLLTDDALGLTPDDNWELGLKCLGGIIWYLKSCLLEHDLLSQKRFEIYIPTDVTDTNANTVQNLPKKLCGPSHMVLDGVTIRNLDILHGPQSLLTTIDKCGTHFGKRLLRHWLCLPLANPEAISARQDAIEALMQQRETRQKIIPLLKSLPDLERLLSKIHYLGSSHRATSHPDGRAFFFEDVKYSKNKISDLISALKGFKTCIKIISELQSASDEFNSTLLARLIGDFPVLDKLLNYFDNAFDHNTAIKDGKIKPTKGALKEYDDALQAVLDIEEETADYLRRISKELKTRVSYFGTDKKRFQLEVPENTKVPRDFEMTPSRKGFKRYVNSSTKEFLSSIQRAEVERDDILRDVARKIFEEFDKSREMWSKAVECVASLDVLISLSLFSESQEVMCKPVVSLSSKPFLHVIEGRHPCVSSDTYIPNDTLLGIEENETNNGSFVILTGPNMGGKSTLMRQVGLLSVLSHLGCYVPAEKCEMSLVDRIFTRLGANDNIGEGESTFFVEMSETSAILRHASADSLLLIDELGRGTATYDGTAIAFSVAKELSTRKCRSLFSTHYHTLVEALQNMPSIQMSHMACMVENENEEDPTQESITFLYKMISGPCPKSYGFNAARLAGITDDVIRVAHKKAKQLESSVKNIRSFTDMCSRIRLNNFSLQDFAALTI